MILTQLGREAQLSGDDLCLRVHHEGCGLDSQAFHRRTESWRHHEYSDGIGLLKGRQEKLEDVIRKVDDTLRMCYIKK